MRRKYELKDIYDYLLRFYNLEWRLYQVKDYDTEYNGGERGMRAWDVEDNGNIWLIALMYQNNKRKSVSLRISNDSLEIYEINPYLHYFPKPEIEWKEFLDRL
jgi:hypothetical protein